MNLIKPKRLKKGDTIAIIAPSGKISEEKLNNGKKYFESLGYNIIFGENVLKKDRYMAGNDSQRVSDLEWAFNNRDVNAIICARGGYGAIRIINKIDYNIIKNNPKIFCGYSDITALSLMILKHTGLITYSSPMIKGDFQFGETNEYTIREFFEKLTNEETNITTKDLITYKRGNAKGILWGGNLATVASLCGQDFIPDEKFIFFCEDLNEEVYKIDKYLRQLININKFKKNLSAITFGEFLDTDKEELKKLFKEIAEELNIPIYSGYKFSHSKEKTTVPIGSFATLKEGIITINK